MSFYYAEIKKENTKDFYVLLYKYSPLKYTRPLLQLNANIYLILIYNTSTSLQRKEVLLRYDDKATICTSITKINLTRRHNKFVNNIQCLVIFIILYKCIVRQMMFGSMTLWFYIKILQNIGQIRWILKQK